MNTSKKESATTTEAANIGPRERRKRRLLGIVALTVSVGIAFLLVVYDAPRWSRVVVFLPLWMAGLGLFQAREKTCIALAARGLCNMDTGESHLEDEELIERLRDKARRINRRSLMTAVLVTILVVAFP